MNILHFIEKIPLFELEFIEHIGVPYFIILYLIDVYCTYRMCKSFNEPTWTSFIPFYNWIVVFKYCWNLKAFQEHLLIEIAGIMIPFLSEAFITHETIELIIAIIDLFIACLGVRHAIEIGVFTLKAYGYNVKKNFIFIFLFDIVLILTLNAKYLGNKSHEHHGA